MTDTIRDADGFYINEEDAKTLQVAMIHYTNYLAEEAHKLADDTSSDFIREAAYEKYNKSVERISELHIRMAKHFPALLQGSVAVR
jgi:hypothetical protein